MSRVDELPPDQKAVLQLLLKRGKTYDDIAGLLRLDRTAVRERALDALDALAPSGATGLSSARQDEVADHLLLQQTASERQATRTFLDGSPEGRAWARSVATELRPIAGDALPEIPAEPAEVEEAFGALQDRTAARERQEKSSKLGGVLVLLALVAAIGLGLVFLLGGDDEADRTASTGTEQTAAASGATGAGAAVPEQQVNLEVPQGSDSKAQGVAFLAEGGLALQAEKLPQDIRYFVWFTNGGDENIPLGFARYDTKTKRLIGALQQLPEGADKYERLIITREKTDNPTKPGTIVLQGALNAS